MDRPRAKILAKQEPDQPTLEEIRNSLGGPRISDDELLLRYAVGGAADVNAMREAGSFDDYSTRTRPIVEFVEALTTRKNLGSISIQDPSLSLVMGRAAGLSERPEELSS